MPLDSLSTQGARARGVIARGRDAQRRPCRLVAAPMRDANAWIERYRENWEATFEALDVVLEDLKEEERARPRRKEKTK